MSLQGFNIPSCFKPEGFGRVTRPGLHHFGDVLQEHGYGMASCCLCLINDQEKIHCSFLSWVNPVRDS